MNPPIPPLQKNNLAHIKHIFSQKTGVILPKTNTLPRPFKPGIILATLLLLCLGTTAFGFQLFSGLSGDDLSISASYKGNGIVTVQVENRSDKELTFQPKLKLMTWNSGEEILPLANHITFTNNTVLPHANGVMTIDLSQAYDINQLEQPLTDDTYYLVLTNNNFVFGQDWMCSIAFAENITTPNQIAQLGEIENTVLGKIEPSLRFYFENISFTPEDRKTQNTAYKEAYTKLLANFEGNIVPSLSPILPGNKIATDKPYLHIQDPGAEIIFDDTLPQEEQYLLTGVHWKSVDSNFKLLATEEEHGLVLSAQLPLTKYSDASTEMPLFFLFTYEKAAVDQEKDYAFLYGQIIPFSNLKPHLVYEDENYLCYEVSSFVYTDLAAYTQNFIQQNPTVRFDTQIEKRVETIYNYYQQNLPSLVYLQ